MQSSTFIAPKDGCYATAAALIEAVHDVLVLEMRKQVQISPRSFSDTVPLPCRSIGGRQQSSDVGPKRTGQNNQLDDINPPLTTFNTRNKRLMTFQSASQLGLRKTSSFAGVRQCSAQRLMPFTSNRLCHADANPLSHQR